MVAEDVVKARMFDSLSQVWEIKEAAYIRAKVLTDTLTSVLRTEVRFQRTAKEKALEIASNNEGISDTWKADAKVFKRQRNLAVIIGGTLVLIIAGVAF